MNLDTPEGRLAAAESLGPDAYNAAMKAHHEASAVATVNGYAIRPVSSPYGQLYMVTDTDKAFPSLEQAETFASKLPHNLSGADETNGGTAQ